MSIPSTLLRIIPESLPTTTPTMLSVCHWHVFMASCQNSREDVHHPGRLSWCAQHGPPNC